MTKIEAINLAERVNAIWDPGAAALKFWTEPSVIAKVVRILGYGDDTNDYDVKIVDKD